MNKRIATLVAILLAVIVAIGTLQQVAAQAATAVTPNTTTAAPILDLNGPEEEGASFAATFTEDQGPIHITSDQLTLTGDTTSVTEVRITLENLADPGDEQLTAVANGSGINVTYNPDSGLLRLSNTASLESYADVLKTVTYDNLSQSPDIADREISFVVKSGGAVAEPVTSTVTINAVNDAPVITDGAKLRLPSIPEDSTEHLGSTVSAMLDSDADFGNPISDPDEGALQGIAVIEVGASNGTWQYSTSGGSSWQDFSTVSNETAVLLTPAARIRFIPKPNFSGQASLTFRAWDQTSGSAGSTDVDVSINGGTTAFSAETETVVQTITAVNDPPIVDLNGALPGSGYSTGYMMSNPPVNITSSDATITDVDNSELVSATLKLTSRPDGPNEILAADTLSTTITAVADANGDLQLTGAAAIDSYVQVLRTATYSNSAASPTMGLRIIEVTVSDGTDTSSVVTSTINLQPMNNAPELAPDAGMAFTPIDEDDTLSAGDTISALLSAAPGPPITDADPDALAGFAVVAADNTHGSWEYSIDSGATWTPFGVISDTTAVLLNTSATIRFVPAPDFYGEAGTITVRAWDQTAGLNGSTGVNTSDNGGSTAYSSATTSIPITVLPVNDPPVVTIGDISPIFREGNGPVEIAGPSLQITDVDSDELVEALIQIENVPSDEPDRLRATTNGTGIDATYPAAGRARLKNSASVADYQSVLRSITYENLSQSPDETPRIISITVSDGEASSETITITLDVQAVNDPPVLDLNGSSVSGTGYSAIYDTESPPSALPIVGDVQLVDVDNVTLASAVVKLENAPDGADELLKAQKSGTNITVGTYNPDTQEIRLSGSDTVANYEKVLATLTYANTAVSPSLAVRTITFTVFDGTDNSLPVQSTVTFIPYKLYMPVIQNPAAIQDEPNNACGDAFPIRTDQSYSFDAEDGSDWYVFELTAVHSIRVELTNFAPEEGQILLLKGSCGNLSRVGNNGNFATTKTIDVGPQTPGTYFVWVLNDGPTNTNQPYNLNVKLR